MNDIRELEIDRQNSFRDLYGLLGMVERVKRMARGERRKGRGFLYRRR